MTALQCGSGGPRLLSLPLPPSAVREVRRGTGKLGGLRVLRGPRGRLLLAVIALVVGGTGLTTSLAGCTSAAPNGGVATAVGPHRVDTGLRLLTPLPQPAPAADLRTVLRTPSDVSFLAAGLRAEGNGAAADKLTSSLSGPPPSGEVYVVTVLPLHCQSPKGAELWRDGRNLTVRLTGIPRGQVSCLGAGSRAGGGGGLLPGGYALVALSVPGGQVPAGALLDGAPITPPGGGRVSPLPSRG